MFQMGNLRLGKGKQLPDTWLSQDQDFPIADAQSPKHHCPISVMFRVIYCNAVCLGTVKPHPPVLVRILL